MQLKSWPFCAFLGERHSSLDLATRLRRLPPADSDPVSRLRRLAHPRCSRGCVRGCACAPVDVHPACAFLCGVPLVPLQAYAAFSFFRLPGRSCFRRSASTVRWFVCVTVAGAPSEDPLWAGTGALVLCCGSGWRDLPGTVSASCD